MDGEAMKKRAQQAQRESEEAEQLEREMREIEELWPRVKEEELRRTPQEKYFELLKRKLKKESEETES
jgi:hemerythrin-like domain-containing protein